MHMQNILYASYVVPRINISMALYYSSACIELSIFPCFLCACPCVVLLTLVPSSSGGEEVASTFEVSFSPLTGWTPAVCEECMTAASDRADMARIVFKVCKDSCIV